MRKMKYYIRTLAITILALISNIGFAETITTNTSINGTKNYSGDVTVRNCTYEINGPVTINGNFIAEGATIIIGENGSLHVTGNFTCQSYEVYGGFMGLSLKSTTRSTVTVDGDLIVNGDINVNGYNSSSSCSMTIDSNGEINSRNLTVGNNGNLTLSGKANVAQTTTINGSATVNNNAEIDTQNLTVGNNGDLALSGKADVAQTTTINGSATVNSNAEIDTQNLTVGNNGDLTISGRIITEKTTTINGSTTVNSEAILYTKSNLTIGEYGALTLNKGSYTFIEGNLHQNGDTPLGWGLLFPHQGDIKAEDATLVVAGNYTIWGEDELSGADQNSDFPDPEKNENFFVFGENNLDIINKITSSPGNRDAFYTKHPNGLAGFIIETLPIELVYFHAHEIGYGVRFEWETASELNNDFFTIEFSIDAVEFAELTKIDGAGTTTEPQNYRYTDFSSHTGIIYYRLKQTDYDGNFSYSETVPVVFAELHEAETNDIKFVIYPNPATDHITISGGEYKSISFVSANGAVLGREAAQGSHDITRLPKGLNFVIIHTANGDVSERFIKR